MTEYKNWSNLLKQDFCCAHNELVSGHRLTSCSALHQSLITNKQNRSPQRNCFLFIRINILASENPSLQNKIQKLQNRAARVLTRSNYDADAGQLFELLGWKNLASQQQIQRATMVPTHGCRISLFYPLQL